MRRLQPFAILVCVPSLAVAACDRPAWLGDLPSPFGTEERAAITGSGYLEAPTVRVASLLPGTVRRLAIGEGQVVRPGDELVVLTNPAIEAQMPATEATLQLAEARSANLQASQPPGAAAMAPALQLAQAECEAARAALRLAQVQNERLTIRAPVAATVAAVLTRTGEQVLPGQVLVRLSRLEELALVIYVPQSRVGELAVGQVATVSSSAVPEKRYRAVVASVSGQPEFTPRNVQTAEDRAGLVYATRLKLDDPDRRLRPGMWGQAEIEVREP